MKPILNSITISLVLTVAFSAEAESSDFRISIRQQSEIAGMANDSVSLLDRIGEKNIKTVRDNVLAKLKSKNTIAADSLQTFVDEETNTMVKGDGWMLQVAGKGNWIRYRDMKNLDKGSAAPIAIGKTQSATTLEKQARDAIAKNLSDIVTLGTGESLELWYTAFEVRGGRNIYGIQQEAVHNSKVVFTRAVDGIPVLGNGSKITVFLTTAGTMVGFDVDWSPIEKSKTDKKTAGLEEIVSRLNDLQSIIGMTDGKYKDTMECGYYDVGARQIGAVQIQPACLVTRTPTTNEGSPVVIAIPAAEEISADALWPEAAALQAAVK